MAGLDQKIVGKFKDIVFLIETVTMQGTKVWNVMDNRRKGANKFVSSHNDKESAEKAYNLYCQKVVSGIKKYTVTYEDCNRRLHTILVEAESNTQARVVTKEEVGRFIKIKSVKECKEVR